jgi:hypothetical protein
MALVYELRASQITRWQRYSDFVALGVAPGLALVVLVRDVEWLRVAAFALSAACSLAAWLWIIFGRVFKWDRQLEVSLEASTGARKVSGELTGACARFENATTDNDRSTIESELKLLLSKHEQIYEQLQKAQITHDEDMNFVAQQTTLRIKGGTCGECGSAWRLGQPIAASPDEARKFFRKNKRQIEAGKVCRRCGQTR